MKLSGYKPGHSVLMPTFFEWRDENSGFVLHMTLIDPVIASASSASHEK
jgi:hypothetical protein